MRDSMLRPVAGGESAWSRRLREPAVVAGTAVLSGLLLAMLGACSGSGEDGAGAISGITETDSAGIPVLLITGERWAGGEGWRVDHRPTLEIGWGDAAQELFRVRGATRLPNGNVVVANAGTGELRWFAPDGSFLRSAGGEGQGPGEFTALWDIRRGGDTLYAHDFMEGRIERFDTAGAFLGGVSLPREDGYPMAVFPVEGGYLGMHLRDFDLTTDLSLQRRVARYVHYDALGEPLVEFARLPGEEIVSRGGARGDQSWVAGGPPLIGHRQWEAQVGDALVAGTTDSWALRVYESGRDGTPMRLVRVLRSPGRNKPVSEEDVERVTREVYEGREVTQELRRNVEARWEVAPPPEVRPAFAGMVGDAEGFVWVRPYLPEPDIGGEPWLVVDPAGEILGQVLLPEGLVVYEIGPDYVLGSVRDDMDVQRIRLHRLIR